MHASCASACLSPFLAVRFDVAVKLVVDDCEGMSSMHKAMVMMVCSQDLLLLSV